ncbi:hypothetical protein TCAL_15189 [Tigriopus californicus]|uniref:Uncharacterized protein n=1 Tax=Tigriopus californicus TaxID=6832 RepID=A0A553ND94_TIGCA|nr:hypothetical protein TCAL_15189 [Tigriopus californicus]
MSEIQSRKVNFCLEQIHLAGKSNSGRRYSTDLLVCAAMWRANSPSFYRQIIQENILTLPSENYNLDVFGNHFLKRDGGTELTDLLQNCSIYREDLVGHLGVKD